MVSVAQHSRVPLTCHPEICIGWDLSSNQNANWWHHYQLKNFKVLSWLIFSQIHHNIILNQFFYFKINVFFSGWIYDWTGDYQIVYYFMGAIFLLSGLLLLLIPISQKIKQCVLDKTVKDKDELSTQQIRSTESENNTIW